MNCNSCRGLFDSENRIPLMLPLCGHSLCKECLEKISKGSEFRCFLCETTYKYSAKEQFPVNESLLHMISFLKKDKLKAQTPSSSKIPRQVPSKPGLDLTPRIPSQVGHVQEPSQEEKGAKGRSGRVRLCL